MHHPTTRRTFLTIAVVTALLTAVALGVVLLGGLQRMGDWYQWWPHLALSDVVEYVRESGPWGVCVAIALMVLHAFVPFPAELVAIANGMVYGPVWGTIITWFGAMLGALLSFGFARTLGRPFVGRMLSNERVKAVDDWLASHGAGALMFSRFMPVIAFNLINYAAGLTRMPWWTFTWVTGVGILPLTILMVAMGHHIETLPWQAWLALLLAGLGLWLLTHRLAGRIKAAGTDTQDAESH